MEVVDVDGVLDDAQAEVVGLADNWAAFDAYLHARSKRSKLIGKGWEVGNSGLARVGWLCLQSPPNKCD